MESGSSNLWGRCIYFSYILAAQKLGYFYPKVFYLGGFFFTSKPRS